MKYKYMHNIYIIYNIIYITYTYTYIKHINIHNIHNIYNIYIIYRNENYRSLRGQAERNGKEIYSSEKKTKKGRLLTEERMLVYHTPSTVIEGKGEKESGLKKSSWERTAGG